MPYVNKLILIHYVKYKSVEKRNKTSYPQGTRNDNIMRKKKILCVITKSVWGGAQRYVFDLATNLPRNRFDVTVAAGGNSHLIQKLHNAEIPTVSIPHLERNIKPINEILSLWSLFKIFRDKRPDVVHLNSSKIGGLGAVAARLAGVPNIIFTAHGWAFNEDRPRWQRSFIVFLSWFAARFQHHIIHVSKRDFDATLALGIAAPKKAEFIPLGRTTPNFLPKDKARKFWFQKTGRKISPGTKLVGTIAELTKNKGLNHLIDAIYNLQSTSYKLQAIIIGEGEEREKLQNKINSLGLQNTVHLAGFVPDAAQYLKAFDIFVLPSLKEGLPYTLLEARHAEIPVAASDVGGVPDIIRHGKEGFLVEPRNPEKLANAILLLLKDGIRTKRTNPDNDLELETMLKKTIALYES